MGSSSSSTTTNKVSNTVINKSEIDILNKNLNNYVSNTTCEQAAICSSSMSQVQNVSFKDAKIKGNLNIGEIDQSQSANITFSCVQEQTLRTDIANGMVSEMLNSLKNNFTSSALSDMIASAEAKSQTQFASTGSSNSDSNSNNTTENYSETIINEKLQNIVENSVTNNLNMKSVSECMNSLSSDQNIDFSSVEVEGSVNIGVLNQSQATTAMQSCAQKQGIANSVTNAAATTLGIKIENESETKTDTTQSGSTSSSAKSVGVFQSIGEGIGDIFSGLFSGLCSGSSTIIIIIIVVVLCLCCAAYAYSSGMLGGGKRNMNLIKPYHGIELDYMPITSEIPILEMIN